MHSLFRKEVFEANNSRLIGDVSLIQPAVFTNLALIVLTFLLVSTVFLFSNEYERKERVPGVIVPDKGVIRVKSHTRGFISEMLVREQSLISFNQPALTITSQKVDSRGVDVNDTLKKNYTLQVLNMEEEIERANEKSKIKTRRLHSLKSSLESELVLLERKIIIMDSRQATNKTIVDKMALLKNNGHSSELELSRQKDILLKLNQDAITLQEKHISLKNKISEIEIDIDHSLLETQSRIAQLKRDINKIKSLTAELYFESSSEIVAPQTGLVTAILKKVGQEVKPNDTLFSILPKGSHLEAVIYVPTSSFGFVEVGQDIRIRYHAFSFHHFGVFKGKIKEVSTNVVYPEESDISSFIKYPSYRVVVSLEKEFVEAYGKKINLRAGMTLDADIIIGKRSLIEWVFEPFFITAKS
ncbi:HlyD family efflux transporter periplasmic adaptor subunit [Thalassotalea euphylliae]|uniref:HlyD family efflux transporter periplasmic adaptor subunit n=1 Tax=Thalassotalea euphylliae TaxID=1655234 RepID=A0A3E0TM11_9GAMM|nr:efflux RND transporter periplasmic adaptor subunit [Thalassotalea euphylliae]REL25591.1 HlyD family efflux transporter periplasmic adaptor subunit [Thalassotalea euphylliae]